MSTFDDLLPTNTAKASAFADLLPDPYGAQLERQGLDPVTQDARMRRAQAEAERHRELEDEAAAAARVAKQGRALTSAAAGAEAVTRNVSYLNPITVLPRLAHYADQALGLVPEDQPFVLENNQPVVRIPRPSVETVERVQRAIGGPFSPAAVSPDTVAGAVDAAAGFGEFFLTPEGMATAGTGAGPALARKALAAGFAASMAAGVPEKAEVAGEASVTGTRREATQHLAELAGQMAFPATLTAGAGAFEDLVPRREDLRTEAPAARAAGPEEPMVLTGEGPSEERTLNLVLAPPSGQAGVEIVVPRSSVSEVLGGEGTKGTKTTEGTVKPAGAGFTASTPDAAAKVSGGYDVVEQGELVTSFDQGFDPALQPRDRSRQASQNQVANIVLNFEPQRLGEAPTTDMGAPMVDELNQVLSGNGRSAALRTLYGTGRGEVYKDWVVSNAERFGLDPAGIAGMEAPVLVRRVTDYGELSKAEFARRSNQQQVMGMGEAEAAASDARMLLENPGLLEAFRPSEEGDVLAASNRGFLNSFIEGTGAGAELLTQEGYNAVALRKRVKNAVLGAVLGPENKRLLTDLIERGEELNLKNPVTAVMNASPDLVKLKGTGYDLSPVLERSLSDLVGLRRSGEKIADFLGSKDLFGQAGRTAETDEMLSFLHEAKSAKQIAEGLRRYVVGARNAIADQQSGGMFGERPLTRAELIRRIYGKEARREGAQEGFAFGKSEGAAGEPGKPAAPADAGDAAAAEGAGGAGGAARGGVRASPAPKGTGGGLGKPAEPTSPPPGRLPPIDDPKFSAFEAMPMELPEAVEMTRLLTGAYPKVLEKLRALGGRALGVFRFTQGEGGKGRIELRADIADLLTAEEKAALREAAREYARAVAEAGDNVETIARERYEYLLEKAYQEAKSRNPMLALKVAWHEIGHLVDWLPEKVIRGRGNLFGRIASLKNYLKGTLPIDPKRPAGEPISAAEKAKLREEALRQMREELGPMREVVESVMVEEPVLRMVGIKPEDVKELFGMDAREAMPELYRWFAEQSDQVKKEIVKKAMKGLLDERLAALGKMERVGTRMVQRAIRKVFGREPTPVEVLERFRKLFREEIERRNLAELKAVKAELEPLIAWWRGTETMEEYFRPAEEMYAEAYSAFINNPAAVAKRAPTYYRLMHSYMDAKPAVAKIYAEIQDRIKSGNVLGERVRNLRASWGRDNELSLRGYRERFASSARDVLDNVQYHVDRVFGPIYRTSNGKEGEGRLRAAIGNFLYRASEHELFLNRMNRNVGGWLVKHNLDWNDLNEFMFHQRVANERFNIFNPLGWTSKNSLERLGEMRQSLGEERWHALDLAQKSFRGEYEARVLPLLREANMFTPELQDVIDNNVWYATFAAVKEGERPANGIDRLLESSFGSGVGAHIFRQIGNLGEIKAPATATVLKALSLISAAHRNIAKREAIAAVRAHDPMNVRTADRRWAGKGWEWILRDTDKVGTVVYMDAGKPQAFYVRRVVAEALNHRNPIENRVLGAVTGATSWLKGLFTQLNYGFWPVNMVRDTATFWLNVPGVGAPIGWAKALPRALVAARASVSGRKANAYADAFLARRMAISRADPRGVMSVVDNEFDLKVASYGLDPAHWGQVADKAGVLVRAWNKYRRAGQVLERMNKIAGMIYLDEKFPNMPEWKKAEIVRERAGSPNFLERGASNAYVDLLMMFYNPWKEAVRSTARAARENPWSFTAKATVAIVMPSLLQTAANMGLLGDDLKKKFRSIPDYDLTNYLNVPLGWQDKDETKLAYLRLPLPEPLRILHGLLFKTTTGRGEGYMSYLGGQVPSMNSLLGVLAAWCQWGLFGHNPYDAFRGQNVLPDDVYAAGGTTAAKELGKWSWNQLGGSLVHRFQNLQLESPPQGAVEGFLRLPIINNVLGRWVKVSDRGIADADRQLTAPIRQRRAEIRLAVREIMPKLTSGGALTDSEKVLLREPYAIEYLLRTLPEVAAAQQSSLVRRLGNAQSKEEKVAILEAEARRK